MFAFNTYLFQYFCKKKTAYPETTARTTPSSAVTTTGRILCYEMSEGT